MYNFIKLLPVELIKKYRVWKDTRYKKNQSWYSKIAREGQKPSAMVISCCDARIHVTSIFGFDNGDFFIHRNIANLIPPYSPDGDHHGTSAAIEYAVKILNVSKIIIMGHSNCGGINSGYNLHMYKKKFRKTIFINKWLNILKPAFQKVLKNNENISDQERINKLEKESILVSISNLIDFPFVKEEIEKNSLDIHGIWQDIGTGNIESLDPVSLKFIKI